MSCGPEPEQNLHKALERIADAAGRGAKVVCLPELFQTQYFCQREDHSLFDLAEPIPGNTSDKLAAAARQHGVVLIASLFEKRAPGIYHNTAAIFDSDGSLCGLYRKMHIPDDPLYYEKFYFTPGDLGFRALDTTVGRIGTLVCWDQWFPEGARLTALQGAQILFYPTAIGWHPAEKAEFGVAQHDAWRTIQRAHAIANGVYVAVVNRVGFETGNVRGKSAPGLGLEFWGASFFCDPFGRVLAEASHDQEEIFSRRRRPEGPRRHPPQLALPPRPPRRRLRPNFEPTAGRTVKSTVNKQVGNTSSNTLITEETFQPPATLAYRMPAEWEPHAATWLAWPHYTGIGPASSSPSPGSTPKSSAI